MKKAPLIIKDPMEFYELCDEICAGRGMVSTKPNPDFPQRLFFASIETTASLKERILVYEPVGEELHRLDDFVYEITNGSASQAERHGDVIYYFAGKSKKLVFTRKIPQPTPEKP